MLQKFINYLNGKHQKLPETVKFPVDTITEGFLIEKGIIEVDHGIITALDTTLIGKDYFWLYPEIIQDLTSIRTLTIANTQFMDLDLTNFKQLKTIHYHQVFREGKLYIAENEVLEKVDISNIETDGEDIYPTLLCAHPKQLGKVFPKNIEKKCLNAEGYQTIRLALAPPQHPKVLSDRLPVKYLWRHEGADLGDILRDYWFMNADYYTKYATLDEITAPDERRTFELLLNIEERVASGFYTKKEVPFDVNEVEYTKLSDRKFHGKRQIHECMFQRIG